MSEKRQFRAIKGTRDIQPPDSTLWNWFEQSARDVFESYNFREIRLPIFEETSLFARSVGGETDIVSKEMYTFYDPPIFIGSAKKATVESFDDSAMVMSEASSKGAVPFSDLIPRDLLS